MENRDFIPFFVDELEQIKRTRSFIDPHTPIDENDVVIGVASDRLKAIYTLGQKLRMVATKFHDDASLFSGNDAKKLAIASKIAMDRADIVMDIFWHDFNNEFGTLAKHAGIRSGFSAVLVKNEPPKEDMIGSLFTVLYGAGVNAN